MGSRSRVRNEISDSRGNGAWQSICGHTATSDRIQNEKYVFAIVTHSSPLCNNNYKKGKSFWILTTISGATHTQPKKKRFKLEGICDFFCEEIAKEK